jgi:hypothetical protein
MRKIRNTATLRTDMLFLLIAVSYLLLTAVTFEKNDAQVSALETVEDDTERVKILLSPRGIFEMTSTGTLGRKVNVNDLARRNKGIELYPGDDVSWRKVRLTYLYLHRGGKDVIIKPSDGGNSL